MGRPKKPSLIFEKNNRYSNINSRKFYTTSWVPNLYKLFYIIDKFHDRLFI